MPEQVKPTAKQYEVITHEGTHARVVAGPGSGKSRTLIGYITRTIQKGIEPKTILVLAFNRAIADKLQKDLEPFLGEDYTQYPVIMTLHSYALKLLKRFRISADIGNATFPSEEEMMLVYKVISRYLRNKGVTYRGRQIDITMVGKYLYPLYSQHYWFGVAPIKPENVSILKQVHDGLDFVKVFFGVRFLSELPAELKRLIAIEPESRIAYKRIIIDEYQDLNLEDIELIEVLIGDETEVIIAGDDDQSICSYRGADSRGLKIFSEKLPNVALYELDECFRCPQKIFQYGQEVVKQIPDDERIQKTVSCTSTRQGFVANWVFTSPKSEMSSLVEVIRQYNLVRPEESILVIVPKRAYVTEYLTALKSAGLAVEDLGSVKHDENLAKYWLVLRALVNPSDQLSLFGIVLRKEPKWEIIFDRLLEKIDWAIYGLKLVDALRSNKSELEGSFNKVNKEALGRVFSLVTQVEEYQRRKVVRALAIKEELLEVSDITKEIFPEYDPASVLAVIEEVVDQITEAGITIEEPFEILSYFMPIIEEKPASDVNTKVSVTTLGRAKGLEADFVIVPDLEDNTLPGPRGLSEAKRLLYVAITRAKKFLIISSVRFRRGGYGAGDTNRFKRPSRLLPSVPNAEKGEEAAQRVVSDIQTILVD